LPRDLGGPASQEARRRSAGDGQRRRAAAHNTQKIASIDAGTIRAIVWLHLSHGTPRVMCRDGKAKPSY
jgi:hypothetical protein